MKNVKLAMSGLSWASGDVPGGLGDYPGEQIIDEIALAGFDGVEEGMYFPQDRSVLKHMLEIRNLVIPSGWYGSFLLTKPYNDVEKEFIQACESMKYTGGNIINVCEQSYSVQGNPEIDVNARHIMNDDEWERLTSGLISLAEAAAARDCVIAYHHHMGTVVQTADDVDRLMKCTEGSKLGLLIDTGHAVYAGACPVQMYSKHASRVKNIHLKDVRKDILEDCVKSGVSFSNAIVKGVFGCPGDGDYDFPSFFQALDKHGYQDWMIVEAEQDPAVYPPFECAKRTHEYIRKFVGA